MAGAYQSLIRLIQDGDDVDAATIDRVLAAITGNVDYVKQLVEQALLGQALFARCQTVEVDAQQGMVVYYNASSQQFERALAAATVDAETGLLTTSASTQAWGVVYYKHNSTLADIMLAGYAPLDISAATGVSEPAPAGTYYLSGSTPGGLTTQSPPVTVPVLQTDGEGNVFVDVDFDDAIEDHKHYKFELQCVPAGTTHPPAYGERHVITNADTSIEGWLPADDPIFGGLAPPNAAFGYNLSVSKVGGVFPPLPLQSVYLEWHKATDPEVGGTSVPLGPLGLCIIDNHGIWWLSDCYGDVPWPLNYDSDGVPTETESDVSEASTIVECPRTLDMLMFLWFTKMSFQTNGTVVTSLTSLSSRLRITCAQNGLAASVGDLEIDLNLGFTTAGDNASGHLVFKSLTEDSFSRGPVVEAIIAGNSNITISSTAPGTGGKQQGTVTISANTQVDGFELPVLITRLNGVREENYKDVIGLEFTAGKSYSERAQINVPFGTIPDGTSMKLRFRFLSRGNGAFPAMTVTYRRIVHGDLNAQLALPTTDGSLTFAPVLSGDLATDYYVDVETASFAVAEGDIVLFTLARASGAAGPTVQLIRQTGVLVAGG